MTTKRQPQFWAVTTTNSMLAALCAVAARDTATVVRSATRYGFVIDVYPDEARRCARDFAQRSAVVLGKFDTTAEPYGRLERWGAAGTA
jgi:hypothetical protein